MLPEHIIIDFDSTFIIKESLDELAHFTLGKDQKKSESLAQIKSFTRAGMGGEIPFDISLQSRVELLNTFKKDIQSITKIFSKEVTPSFERNISFIQKYASRIFIISGGFKEMILPIVSEYGISSRQVFGNEFIYNSDDKVIGLDKNNLMSENRGKTKLVKSLQLSGNIDVIGDGFTDYEIKKSGYATRFYAFIENINRINVSELADGVLESFDDYINIIFE